MNKRKVVSQLGIFCLISFKFAPFLLDFLIVLPIFQFDEQKKQNLMTASYADIIFFAVVAVYLGLKLFSVLGKKNEQDSKIEIRKASIAMPEFQVERESAQQKAAVVQAEKNKLENFTFLDENAKNGVKEIIEKDPSFALESFVEGAKMALEMLFKAFSTGDKKTLKQLLADDIYPGLEKQLDEHTNQNLVHIKSLVAIENVEIASASVAGSRAKIGLKFLTEQISVTKDSNGNIVSGNPKAIETVEDFVEFERNTRSSNPNWSITSL